MLFLSKVHNEIYLYYKSDFTCIYMHIYTVKLVYTVHLPSSLELDLNVGSPLPSPQKLKFSTS